MPRIAVVIARFKETLDDWLPECASSCCRFFVYDKSPTPIEPKDASWKVTSVPNVGREAETYVRAICDLYDSLVAGEFERVVFLQGWPFDHCHAPMLKDALAGSPTLDVDAAGTAWLGSFITTCDGTGRPHTSNAPLSQTHDAIFETSCQIWKFVAGAQFSVPVANILARPLHFWKSLHSCCVHAGDRLYIPFNPWVMERLWPCLFDPSWRLNPSWPLLAHLTTTPTPGST